MGCIKRENARDPVSESSVIHITHRTEQYRREQYRRVVRHRVREGGVGARRKNAVTNRRVNCPTTDFRDENSISMIHTPDREIG